jgi:hypothetical protein
VRRLFVALAALALVPAALGAYGGAKQAGTITSEKLPEVSGMTAATVARGGWWVLNDSGNTPDIHLITRTGKLLQSVRVSGVENVDWEDLASGPAPRGRRYLYVGDIGDNGHVRDDLVVYRVPEPRRGQGSVAPTAFPFRYPDGRQNAEALFVDPDSGRIYVLTKSENPSAEPTELFRFPLPLQAGKQVAPLVRVTGAAVSPDGTRLAIRTYFDAWEFHRKAGSAFAAVFDAPFEDISIALERQGESIAYTSDGKALATTSEQIPAPIWRYGRR